MWRRIACCLIGACLTASASCGSSELGIAGRALIDGEPMDSGTIRFEPIEGESGSGVGTSAEAGAFEIPAAHGLLPGRYRVEAQAFKKTGRTVADPQRGQIEEMALQVLRDSPQEIELTPDNSEDLTIEFTTASQK